MNGEASVTQQKTRGGSVVLVLGVGVLASVMTYASISADSAPKVVPAKSAGLAASSRGVGSGVPLQINHQGVVQVGGVRFNGTGLFRFAIVDPGASPPATETYLWTNDNSPVTPPAAPTAAVNVEGITNGVYSVALGDASLPNMTTISSTVFNNDNVVLRIWFDDGPASPAGVERLTPDHPLSTSPYAFRAAVVSAAEGLNIPGTSTPAMTVGGTGDIEISGGDLTVRGDLNVSGHPGSSSNIIVVGGFPRIVGTANIAIHVDSDNDTSGSILFQKGAVGSPQNLFTVANNGNVSGLHGSYHVASDVRLKKDISRIPNALSRVLSLRGVNFKWKNPSSDRNSLQMGVIAQEVEAVFPEVVHTAKDGMKTKAVEYEHLVGALIEAIKEQNAEIVAMKKRVERLEAQVSPARASR